MRLDVGLLVGGIAALTGLITFFVSRYDKNKDPLPKQTAEMALAREALNLIDASAKRLSDDVTRLTARVTTLEQQRKDDASTIEAQQTKIAGLERRVAGVIEDRDALVAYVVTIRLWVAGGSRPPAPTPPRHLADVLPPWEAGDGAEVTPETTD